MIRIEHLPHDKSHELVFVPSAFLKGKNWEYAWRKIREQFGPFIDLNNMGTTIYRSDLKDEWFCFRHRRIS